MFSRCLLSPFVVLKVLPQIVQTSFPGSIPRKGSSGGAGTLGKFTFRVRIGLPYGGLRSLIEPTSSKKALRDFFKVMLLL